MKKVKFDQHFEIKVASLILAVFIIVSIMSGYIEKFVHLPKGWEIPIILASLLLISRTLMTLYRVDDNIKKLLSNIGWMEVKRYDTYQDFYHDLNIEMKKAKISLDLTHIRNEPPADFVLGKAYYDGVKDWCQSNPGAPVRRITAINNLQMLNWAHQLLNMSDECKNFYVRICDWQSEFPMINMAILDHSKVFVAITSDVAERTSGLQINDKIMAKYFCDYFENVWAHSEKLTKLALANKESAISQES